jgi:multisubunit Na+/H+ antiporter MnhG subunit
MMNVQSMKTNTKENDVLGVIVGAVIVVLVAIGVVVYQRQHGAAKNAGFYVGGVTNVTSDTNNVNSIDVSMNKIAILIEHDILRVLL